jgi:hypothetical protein
MTISFKCRKCGKQYKVSDDKAGRKIKCRQCEAVMKIPVLEADDFLEELDDDEDDLEMDFTPPVRRRKQSPTRSAKPKRKKKKSKSGSNQGVAIAVGAVAFLVMAGVGFFLFSSGGKLFKKITDKADQVVNSSGLNNKSARDAYESEVDKLKRVGLAFHHYHDSFRRFPYGDPHLVDGKPMLSWRVHLLPFLNQNELYNQFKLDEPWDGPHNKKLLAKMPDIYQFEGISQPGYTTLMTYTGNGALFDGGQGPRMRDITDGSSNVLLAVKAGPDKAVPWTQPVDLPFVPANPLSALGQPTHDRYPCILADGSVRSIPAHISPQTLSLLIQHKDGQVMPVF